MSEGGGASGSVARPPGAGTIRVSTRGRIRGRTNFVRRGRPGGREEDAELEGGEIRRAGEGKKRAEMGRVVVYDNDDNRYLGNQVTSNVTVSVLGPSFQLFCLDK